jgi:hypothetical protein
MSLPACPRSFPHVPAHGAAIVVLALVAINQWVLLGFANSGDEYAY